MFERQIDNRDPCTKVAHYNGITFIARRVQGSPQFTIAALVEAGKKHQKKPEITHLHEHLCITACGDFRDNGVIHYLKECGGGIAASTSYNHTQYTAHVDTGHELNAIHALADIVCRPRYTEDHVRNEIETICDEWAFIETDDSTPFLELLVRIAYGDQYCARSRWEEQDSVRQLNLCDIQDYIAENYCGEGLIVAMEGDWDPDTCIKWAMERFQLPRGQRRNLPDPLPFTAQTFFSPNERHATRVSIILPGTYASASLEETSADKFLSNMLFGLSGPVLQEARFKRRLIYDTGIGVSTSGIDRALDVIMFAAFPEKVGMAVESIAGSIQQFLRQPDKRLFHLEKAKHIQKVTDEMRRIPEFGAKLLANHAYAHGIIYPRDAYVTLYSRLRLEDVISHARSKLSGPVSVLYEGPYRPDFPTHERISELLRGSSAPPRILETDARVTRKPGGNGSSLVI